MKRYHVLASVLSILSGSVTLSGISLYVLPISILEYISIVSVYHSGHSGTCVSVGSSVVTWLYLKIRYVRCLCVPVLSEKYYGVSLYYAVW